MVIQELFIKAIYLLHFVLNRMPFVNNEFFNGTILEKYYKLLFSFRNKNATRFVWASSLAYQAIMDNTKIRKFILGLIIIHAKDIHAW